MHDSGRNIFIIFTFCACIVAFLISGVVDECGWWWKPWTVWWTGPVVQFRPVDLVAVENSGCTQLPLVAAELLRSRMAPGNLANIFWALEHARIKLGAAALPAFATGYTSLCAFAWHRNKSLQDTRIIVVNPVILDWSQDTVLVNEVGAWTSEWNGEHSRATWIVGQWLEVNASRVFCNPGELTGGPQTHLPAGLVARTTVRLDGQEAFVFQSMMDKLHSRDD